MRKRAEVTVFDVSVRADHIVDMGLGTLCKNELFEGPNQGRKTFHNFSKHGVDLP